ncbi:MAG: hypothetical protein V4474_01605 [Patescibacteria group bacterium]
MKLRAYMQQVVLNLALGILLTAFLGWFGLYNHVFQIDNYVSATLFAICFALAFGSVVPLVISLRFGFRPIGMVNAFFGFNSTTIALFGASIVWILVLAGIFNYLDPFTIVGY